MEWKLAFLLVLPEKELPLKNYYRSPELASGLAPKLLAILPSLGVAPPEPPVRPNFLPETKLNVRVLLSLPRAEGSLKRIGLWFGHPKGWPPRGHTVSYS